MSKPKKSNLGLLKHSLHNPICEGNANASVPSVSKYFKNITSSSSSSEPFDSPYKNSLSHIKNISLCDDDFGTPTYVKKISKLQPKQNNKILRKNRAKSKTSKRIDSIFKEIRDRSEAIDVNPDHLQMALALSKSSYESENPECRSDQEQNPQFPMCPDKIPKIHTTLERFGFKSKRPQLDSEYKFESDIKRKKYSRFRYVTPTLLMRTDKDRRSLLQSKISLILTERQLKVDKRILNQHLFSETLEKLHAEESRLMKINSLEYKYFNSSHFYIDINIPRDGSVCGCLLKKWSEIPGRDLSPERDFKINLNLDINQTNDMINQSNIGELDSEKNTVTDNFSSGRNVSVLNQHLSIENSTKCENFSIQCADHTSLHDFPSICQSERSQSQNSSDCHASSNHTRDTYIPSLNHVEDTFKILSVQQRCVSPDLFDSSYETSPKVKGIEHFESFNQNSESLSQELCNYSKTPQKSSGDLDTASNNICEPSMESSRKVKGIEHCESFNQNSESLSEELCNYSKTPQKSLRDLDTVSKNICEPSMESEDSDCTLGYDIPNIETIVSDINGISYLKSNSIESKNCVRTTTEDAIDLTQSSNENEQIYECDENRAQYESQEDNNYNSDYELPSFREYLKKSFQGEIINLTQSSGSDTESYEATQTSPIPNDVASTSKEFSSLDSSNGITCDRLSLLSKQHSSYNCSSLNITDYIHEMLNNQNVSKRVFSCGRKSNDTHYCEDSFLVSDEELNYSSLCSAKQNCNDNFSINMNNKKTFLDSAEKSSNYGNDSSTIIDGELNYSVGYRHSEEYDTGNVINENTSNADLNFSTNCAKTERCRKFYDLSDDDDEISKVFIDDIDKANSELQEKYFKTELQSQSFDPRVTNKEENHVTDGVEVLLPENSLELKNMNSLESVIVPSCTFESQACTNSVTTTSDGNEVLVPNDSLGASKQTKIMTIISNVPSNDFPESPKTPVMKFKLKTKDVTPEPDYERMNSPDIVRQLKRFGIKRMTRNRGIQFLRYIYECTHPLVDSEEARKFCEIKMGKRAKRKKKVSINCLAQNNDTASSESIVPIHDNFMNNMTSDDFILERNTSTKIISCGLPLQIAWHNLVCCNDKLRESLLTYEPLQLEIIHKILKEETGCKYHIEDLIKFLDQKCITFRMLQSGPRTKKRI